MENDFIGSAIVQKSKNTLLNNLDRDRLADIIITNFLNHSNKMEHNDFRIVSQKITELMPNEKISTYFVEPIRKKDSKENKSERARGKLVEKYRNRLHLLRTIQGSTQQKELESKEAADTGKTV